MNVKGTRLAGCQLEMQIDEEVSKRIQAIPEADRLNTTEFETQLLEHDARPDGDLVVNLVVKATGCVRPKGTPDDDVIRTWNITVFYQGAFQVDDGAEVSRDDVLNIYGPTHLYAFAREHVADLSRRASMRGIVYLPPWNFAAKNDDG